MEQFQIETAQNISISQNTAHLGDRMLAFLIDTCIIITYYMAFVFILIALDLNERDMWSLSLLMSLPAFLYYLLFETLNNGKTIGKSAMKIRVVKLDGSPPDFGSYFIRWILRFLDILLSLGGIAILTILIGGKGQRLGDIAAGTAVISEKQPITLKDILWQELPTDYIPKYPQVTIFKDQEMQTIKDLFDSARQSGNYDVILSLSNRIKEVTTISTELMPIDFVDVVIKDYTYYTQQ